MPGQILSFANEHRDFLVAEKVADERAFTDVVAVTRVSRPTRYIALLSFADDRITHAALAIRGSRVATAQVRIRYEYIRDLTPVRLSAIADSISPTLRHHLTSHLDRDGWLPEHTWQAALNIVRQDLANNLILQELERRLSNTPPAMTPRQFQVLTEERDALGLALQVFDPNRSSLVPSLGTITTPDEPFLAALRDANMPEDFGIAHDTNAFDGWIPREVPVVGARTFERNGQRLIVANVNRTRTENVLGVDLIYFHTEYRSFVCVQYKRMQRDNDNQPFYRPTGKSYELQYRQMKTWDGMMRACPTPPDLPSYRLGRDAFFFKIYANPIRILSPDRLLKGMYFPLSYWNALIASRAVRGPRDGVRITYDNVGRYFNNTEFTDLVGNGWVGSPPQVEVLLTSVIGQALENRHSVTLAVAQQAERSGGD